MLLSKRNKQAPKPTIVVHSLSRRVNRQRETSKNKSKNSKPGFNDIGRPQRNEFSLFHRDSDASKLMNSTGAKLF